MRPTKSDTVWVGVGAVMSGLGGFAFTWAVARGAGAAGAGVVLTLTTWFTLLFGITKLGMDTTLVREGGRIRAGESATGPRPLVAWTAGPAVALAALVGLIAAVAAPRVAQLILPDSPVDLPPLVITGAVALPAAVWTVVMLALLRGLGSIRSFVAVEQIGKPTGRTLGALVLLALGVVAAGVYFAVWLIPVWIGAFATVYLARRVLRHQPGEGVLPVSERKRLWSYAWARAVSQIVDLVNSSLGTIILGALAGAAAAGHFATAFRVVVAGQLAFQAVQLLLAPSLAALLATHQVRDADETFASGASLIVLAAWPIFLVCLILPDAVLSVFGGTFAEAAGTLQVLALSGLLLAVVGTQGSVILMSGRSSYALLATSAALAVNLVVTFALVNTLGPVAAALGWTGGILLEGILLGVGLRRLGMTPLPRLALRSAFMTAATIGTGLLAFRLLWDPQPVLAVVALVIGAVVWLVLGIPAGRHSLNLLTHQKPSAVPQLDPAR
jgi:O-antigen/teichoic acid export membrane protein